MRRPPPRKPVVVFRENRGGTTGPMPIDTAACAVASRFRSRQPHSSIGEKYLGTHRYPHPPSVGALGSPSPAVRERGSVVGRLQPLSRTAGEGGEHSEPGPQPRSSTGT